MSRLFKYIIAVMFFLNILTANQENAELELIKSILPKTKISKIEKSNIDGVYKVFLPNGQIVYTYPFKKLLFFGEIYNTQGFNYTSNDLENWGKDLLFEEIIKKHKPEEFYKVGKKIEFNKGSKKYNFIMFSDVTCPYCKKTINYFRNKNSTVYYIFNPLKMHKNSKKISLNILNDSDFKNSILNYSKIKFSKKISKKTISYLNKMINFSKKVKINAVPTLIVVDKINNKIINIIPGANLDEIKKYL